MKGFTLIEVLVSVFLVLLAVLLVGRVLIFSMNTLQDSLERFSLSTEYANYQNRICSIPFDSTQLAAGVYQDIDDGKTIEWRITDQSSKLKKIILNISDKKRKIEGYFYHSLLLTRRKK